MRGALEFLTRQGISWTAERLLASRVGFCTMELFGWYYYIAVMDSWTNPNRAHVGLSNFRPVSCPHFIADWTTSLHTTQQLHSVFFYRMTLKEYHQTFGCVGGGREDIHESSKRRCSVGRHEPSNAALPLFSVVIHIKTCFVDFDVFRHVKPWSFLSHNWSSSKDGMKWIHFAKFGILLYLMYMLFAFNLA